MRQSALGRAGNVRASVLAGLATAGVLTGVLAWASGWCRDHFCLMWSAAGVPLFYAAAAVLVVLPAGLVALLVDRQARLRRDVSAKRREIASVHADLARTNRALAALSAVNHELVRAVDETTLLSRICQVMVEKAGYSLAWAGLVEPGPERRVRVAARAGEGARFLDVLDIRCDDSPRGRGPTGTAIREGRVAVVSNFHDEAFFRNWPDRPQALDRYLSGVSLPLRNQDRVIGALTIYETRPRDFGQEELSLLSQMAGDVSYGLRFLRLAEERERARRFLRQALRLTAAMAHTAQALVVGDSGVAEMAALVLRQSLRLTGSAWGGVGLVAERTGRIDWVALAGPDQGPAWDPAAVREVYPDDQGRYAGPWGEVVNAGVAVCQNSPVLLDDFGPCPPGQPAARFLAVPLGRGNRRVLGLMLLADSARPYGERDARAISRLAVLLDMGISRRRAEEELVLARRRAEAASEARTQFLANVSHELRTPINGILGMAQLAVLEGAPGVEDEYWRTVRDSADRLVKIVDNLLELADVESGALSPMLREFSPRRLLESLRGAFAVRASLAGLTLSVETSGTLPEKLLGDPFRLRQILANLIDNAIRFTPSGAVMVRVQPFAPQSGPRRIFVAGDFTGISLLFSVADTGIGIPRDKQTAIFESFTLAEDYLTKRFGGTGMGLAIARRLAELLGGSIWVESRPDFGSTFYLAVPFWPATAPDADRAEAAGPLELPALRFLVVEDEAVNRLALARSLRKLGHTVVEAGNGEEALRHLAMERVDVVVMDIQMPVMDGLTAVTHIRNGEVPGTDRRLPVVALTAYALEGDRKRFLDAGMDEFVTKPCDISELLRTVAKVVQGKAGS